MTWLQSVLGIVIVFGVVVFVHEFGHFLAAKLVGVYAPIFSIGFGPTFFRIQPDEGITLLFEAKVPGMQGELRQVSMDFDYCRAFRTESPEAYQRLLLDAMLGDATLFAREDEVVAAWTLITPILEEWERAGEPELYPAGSWGPAGSDALLRADGRAWREV